MRKNRLVCLMLAALMLLSLVPGMAAAEEAREEITIQMLSMPSNTSGLIDGWVGDYLRSELGINVELLPAGDQGEQKLQALMAADSLPDMVVFKEAKQVLDAQRANMLVAYDDHMDKLPNAAKYAEMAMRYYADAASTDGKCYSIPNDIGVANLGDELNWSVSLRWDLYKKLGSPELKTVDDYLPLLKQMQDMEPTNEDGQKVYGMTLWSDWDNYTMHQAMQPSVLKGIDTGDQLGAKLPFAQVDLNTMELSSTLTPDSEYIKGLRFFYDANQLGIVDPDSMTQRFDTALEKAKNGRVLFGWWSWAVNQYNTEERNNADDFKGFQTIIPDSYKAFLSTNRPVGAVWSWSISAKSKYVDRCLEYVDFMLDPEKLVVLHNGPKGETWDVGEDGKPFVTEKGYSVRLNPDETLAAGRRLADGEGMINSVPLSRGMTVESLGEKIDGNKWPTYERPVTKLLADWQQTMGYKNGVERSLALNLYTAIPLATDFIAPLPDDMQMLVSQIGDVVKNDSWLIVFAKDDAEFDQLVGEMIEKANALGVEQVIEYDKIAWQAAIDMAKKYE